MTRSFALLGSGEFEPWSQEVDRWMLDRVARPDGPVLILPSASAPEGDDVFTMWADMGLRHFERLETPAEVLPMKTREDAYREEFADRLDQASFAYFSGGNPAYLAGLLRETPFWDALVVRLDDGLGYTGCSAGMACLGEVAPDSSRRDFTDDVWQPGLKLFPKVHFGPHWDMLDTYIPGLRDLIASSIPDDCKLFAVDERTAAVGDGNSWSVYGLGRVHLRDETGSWSEWSAGESFTVPLLTRT